MQLVINTLEGEALCLGNNTVFLSVQFFSSLKTLESVNRAVRRMLRNTRYRMLQGLPRVVGAHFLEENSHWISYETSMPVPIGGVGVCRNLVIFDSLMPPGSSVSLPLGVYVPPGSPERDISVVAVKFLPGEFETFDRANKELGDPLIAWISQMLLFLEVYRAYCDGLVTNWDEGPSPDVLHKLPYYMVTIRGHATQQTAGKMNCGVYALGHLAGVATSAVVVSDDREGTRRLRSFEETIVSMFGCDSPVIRDIREAFRSEALPGQFDTGQSQAGRGFLFAPAVGSKVSNPEVLRMRLQTLLRPNYLPIKHHPYAVMKMIEWLFANLLQPQRIRACRPRSAASKKKIGETRDYWGGSGSGTGTDEEAEGVLMEPGVGQEQTKLRLVVHSDIMDVTYWMDWIANLLCVMGIWDLWEIVSFENFRHWMDSNDQQHFLTPQSLKTMDPWCVPAAVFSIRKSSHSSAQERSQLSGGTAILGRYICSNTTTDPATGTQHVQPITVLNAFLEEVSPAHRPEYCAEKDWHMQVYSSARKNGVPASFVPEFFSRQAPPSHSAPSASSNSRQYLNNHYIDIKAQGLFVPSSAYEQTISTACDVNAFPCRLYATGWDSYHVFRKLDADAEAYAKKRATATKKW